MRVGVYVDGYNVYYGGRMRGLRYLHCTRTLITDFSPLAGLTGLEITSR
jgi:hypothetical protein